MAKKKKTRKPMKPAKKKKPKKKEKGVEPIRLYEVPWKLSQIITGLKARRDELTNEQRVFEKERDKARRKFCFSGGRKKSIMQREAEGIDALRSTLGFISNALAIDEDDEDEDYDEE